MPGDDHPVKPPGVKPGYDWRGSASARAMMIKQAPAAAPPTHGAADRIERKAGRLPKVRPASDAPKPR
jgi:hypothetical protein